MRNTTYAGYLSRNTNRNHGGWRDAGKRILMTVTPTPGHVNPLLTIACHLRDQGYVILFNTAEVFRKQVESEGIRFEPLIGTANFDYRTFNKFLPEGQTLTPGPEEMIHNMQHVFGDTMLPQCDGIKEIMRREKVDLILTDFMFFGVFPLLLDAPGDWPPIISVCVSPIVLSSVDASPFAPVITAEEKQRNREETAQFQASLAPATEYLNRLLRGYGCRSFPSFPLDCVYTLPDLLLQLSVEALEFPRSDMPSHIKFVGPVLPTTTSRFQPPQWWNELDGSKPVVLVTQGTVANMDLDQLIGPTLAGLRDENVTMIAATGRPGNALTAAIPSNARLTSFIPFVDILPKVDVFVTNGGYGAVNQALSMGVPLVVAGDTEDKAFVAARAAWTGAAINLGTSRPAPEQIRCAVREVLTEDGYRTRARHLQQIFAQHDALKTISGYVGQLLIAGRNEGTSKIATREKEITDHGTHSLCQPRAI
ncbi:MAG TPA: glycosyltransferase [Silvibacterium sp.]|nr:glycosyltransferase [Silvibacterium sp.]